MSLLHLEAAGAYGKAAETIGLPGYYKSINICKPQCQGRATSTMALSILVVVG